MREANKRNFRSNQKKSIGEELIDQHESSLIESKYADGLSLQLDSFDTNRDRKTEENDDYFHGKSTNDSEDPHQHPDNFEQNAIFKNSLNFNSPKSKKDSCQTDKKKILDKNDQDITKKSLNIPLSDFEKKKFKRIKYKFYKLSEYATSEDSITMYPIETFKKLKYLQIFRNKNIFRKNNMFYIVKKKKQIEQLSFRLTNNAIEINDYGHSLYKMPFDDGISFNNIVHDEDDEINIATIENIRTNQPRFNLSINAHNYINFPSETNDTD